LLASKNFQRLNAHFFACQEKTGYKNFAMTSLSAGKLPNDVIINEHNRSVIKQWVEQTLNTKIDADSNTDTAFQDALASGEVLCEYVYCTLKPHCVLQVYLARGLVFFL